MSKAEEKHAHNSVILRRHVILENGRGNQVVKSSKILLIISE
jgi:hypothetical protein